MALERVEVLDSIDIRPTLKQVGYTKLIHNVVDGETVSTNRITHYFHKGDDISGEDPVFQDMANHYWSTL